MKAEERYLKISAEKCEAKLRSAEKTKKNMPLHRSSTTYIVEKSWEAGVVGVSYKNQVYTETVVSVYQPSTVNGYQYHSEAAILTRIVMATTKQVPASQSLGASSGFLTWWPGLHIAQ